MDVKREPKTANSHGNWGPCLGEAGCVGVDPYSILPN